MRIGMNPQKQEKKIELQFHHRLIIVVFIPKKETYYQSIFDVFKLCLESAIATVNTKCAITVVNNASHNEVEDYINEKFNRKEINSVIHHNENIGKMDAIIGAARSSREPLITISDVDVLFKYGWQQEVEKVFVHFKNVGSVSPIPVKSTFRYANSSTLKQILLKKIKFSLDEIPENNDAYNLFLSSINWDKKSTHDSKWPVVHSNNHKAILGSTHQILTVDRNIIMNNVPTEPSLTLIGQNSVYNYCDGPVDLSGGLRLATYNNFAYHMGNTAEDWMYEVQKKNLEDREVKSQEIISFKLKLKTKNNDRLLVKLRQRIIFKIFDLLFTKKIKESI
jgi:hypothetical protein